MKKQTFLVAATLALTISMVACNSNTSTSSGKPKPSSSSISSTDTGPKKSVSITNISLTTESSKAYVKVTGTQSNYTADEFKWAWGLREQGGDFADGKANPAEADFVKVDFDSSNAFTVKYCLTDIKDMKAGVLYRIYGGTPESYADIPFQSNNYGAKDAERNYYLRQDQDNSLIYDSIQPIKFNKASIVAIEQSDLPEGVVNPGAYLKFGGANTKNYTIDQIDALNTSGKMAGDFQRVIGDGYSTHAHNNEERFYKIEGSELYFYLYVGFIAANEGWMVHFDMVGGSSNAGLSFETTLAGETSYHVGDEAYKIYADKNKSGEENYWGCLGVFRAE